MTYTPPSNDAIELEFTEYTPDAGDAVTIPIQEALNSNIALSNDAVDFTFDTTDAYQAPVNNAVNFQLVDIVSVVGATVEEPLTIPAPTGSGPANVPLTTSGPPPLPGGVTNDGQFAWGDTSTPETDSATVVLQWTRPQPAIDPPPGIEVAEVVTATYTPPDGTPITVTERLIDPARDPNTGTQQDTPVAIDQNPPAGDVTYQVTLFYYDETAVQHGSQVVSRSVDTTEAVQFNWPDTISDPTTRVTTVDLRREGPLTVPDTATIVSDVVTGRYDGTTYTLGSGGLAGRGILHDVNAPAGMITYARTITYDTQSGTRETVSKTRMKDTRAPPAPLSVTAQRTGTTIDQSLPYDYLRARVSPQSVPVTATPTIATAVNGAIPDSGLLHEWDAQALSAADGDTIDPLPDQQGALDLPASGAPSYETTTNISEPAVFYDGTDDKYNASSFGGAEDGTISLGFVIEPLRRNTLESFMTINHSEIAVDLRLDNGVWNVTFPAVAEYTGGTYASNSTYAGVFVYDGSTAILDVGDTTPINISTSTSTDPVELQIGSDDGGRYANFHSHYQSIYDDAKDSQTRQDIISGLESKFGFTSADA
jgi:hypothetical protein